MDKSKEIKGVEKIKQNPQRIASHTTGDTLQPLMPMPADCDSSDSGINPAPSPALNVDANHIIVPIEGHWIREQLSFRH